MPIGAEDQSLQTCSESVYLKKLNIHALYPAFVDFHTHLNKSGSGLFRIKMFNSHKLATQHPFLATYLFLS